MIQTGSLNDQLNFGLVDSYSAEAAALANLQDVGAEVRDSLTKPARPLLDVHMQRYFVMADSRISPPRLEKKIIAVQLMENSFQS
jgi:hypothetical protein